MDRNKGIWVIIACIFVVGLAVTFTTSKYITHQEETGQMETTAAAAFAEDAENADMAAAGRGTLLADNADGSIAPSVPGTAASGSEGGLSVSGGTAPDDGGPISGDEESVPGPGGAASGHEEAVPLAPAAVQAEEEDVAAESSASVVVEISPLEGPSATRAAGSQSDLKEYYLTRLNDLDAQIRKMRAEETDSTTYSMKSAAANELKLWDNELNTIYSVILKQMTEEESKKLVEEERAWMKARDSAATDAAQKYSGGTIEGLEYTASLAESTKARAYELVETYFVNE